MAKLRLSIVLVLTVIALVMPTFGSQAQLWSCTPRTDWTQVHVVQRGETLARIAARYGTTWTQLAQGNCITNPNFIYAGQQIRVPTGGNQPTPQPIPNNQVLLPNYAINAYSAPNLSQTIVHVANGGSALAIGRNYYGKWLMLQFPNGVRGWVETYHIPATSAFIQALPVLDYSDRPQDPNAVTARVTASGVRLRGGPGLDKPVITYVSFGTVTVLGRSLDGNWLMVTTSRGLTGWMWSYFVELEGSLIQSLAVMGTD